MPTQFQEKRLLKMTQNPERQTDRNTLAAELHCQAIGAWIPCTVYYGKESIALVGGHGKLQTSHFSAYTGPQRAGESSACQTQSDLLPRVKVEALSAAGLVAPYGCAGF